MISNIPHIISGRPRDLGGFHVRRILPAATKRMVGPFIFFDHMGPADFSPGQGIDVRPHPHVNLATVTYLFEGKILHRDSLGSSQLIEPGAINWMVAGNGIVHSERTPEELRNTHNRLEGIQCWVALPEKYEDIPASFTHYPESVLPHFTQGKAKLKLLLGKAFSNNSPVKVYSEIFYLHVTLPKGEKLSFNTEGAEAAAYIVNGEVQVAGEKINQYDMVIHTEGKELVIQAITDTEFMLLGGKPLGERFIYWNFVSSSEEKIDVAKAEWAKGPGAAGSRFKTIPGDDQEFIPLPEDKRDPKGSIM